MTDSYDTLLIERHADGYAIRLRGVSTLGNDGQKK